MVEATGAVERSREREMWRRFAFLAAEVINISGKSVKHPVRADQLIKFGDEQQKSRRVEDVAERRRQFAETVALHKSKFWTKLKDESVKKVTGE